MTLAEFRDWAIAQGSVANPNGSYPSQCVSLIQQYLNRVYGIPFTPRGHAKDWATNGSVLSYFDKVGSPQAGDIGVSGAVSGNPYGHIWIYTSPSTILEQNGRVSRRVSTGGVYANPIAILRRKGTPAGEDMIQAGDNWYARLNKLHTQVRGVGFPRADFNNYWVGKPLLTFIEAVSDSKNSDEWYKNGEIGAVARRDNWEGQIYTLQKQFADATKVANDLQARLVQSENTTKALTEKVDKLNKKVEELDSPDKITITRTGFNGLFDKIKGFFK